MDINILEQKIENWNCHICRIGKNDVDYLRKEKGVEHMYYSDVASALLYFDISEKCVDLEYNFNIIILL